MHGLFVDDMIHSLTSKIISDKLISEYQEDFDITLEDLMSLFLGMEIKQNKLDLTNHLDTYIQETLAEYKAAVTKFLKPRQVQMQQGIMWELEDCPESPDPHQGADPCRLRAHHADYADFLNPSRPQKIKL
jgi:hypothetical protein